MTSLSTWKLSFCILKFNERTSLGREEEWKKERGSKIEKKNGIKGK